MIENHPQLGSKAIGPLGNILAAKDIKAKSKTPVPVSKIKEVKPESLVVEEKKKETIYLVDGHVAIAIDEPKKETASGLILSAASIKHDRPNVGYVLYISKDSTLEVGQKVMFLGWQEPVEYEGEKFFIIRHEDIKAIIV